MSTCPYDASQATMLASTAPVGPSVLRIGMERLAEPHWEWLDCHDRPLADAETRFPKRTTWREPPVGPALCCMPPRGCFRAVLDDAIPMPKPAFKKGQKVLVRQSMVRPSPSEGWQLGRVAAVEPQLRVRLSSCSNRTGQLWDEVALALTPALTLALTLTLTLALALALTRTLTRQLVRRHMLRRGCVPIFLEKVRVID